MEALSRFVPLACDLAAPDPPDGLRAHLRTTLPPGGIKAEGASAEADFHHGLLFAAVYQADGTLTAPRGSSGFWRS